MTTANKIIGAIVALVLVVIVGLGFGHGQKQETPVAGAINPVTHFESGVWWFNNTHYFGSAQQMSVDSSGNVVTAGTYSANGVTSTTFRSTMTAATTTPCVLGPVTGTSTIEALVASITSGTTTASTLTFATSTTPYATSSLIAQKTVATGGQVTFDWHPVKDNSVIFPNTYVVLGQQGGIGTFSNAGTCNMVVRSVN